MREGGKIVGIELTQYLKSYAANGELYIKILDDIINRNSLTDFDNAGLLPIKLKKGVSL